MRERTAWMRCLAPDQEDAVRAAYSKGVSAADLGARYGVTKRTIYRTLKRGSRDVYRVKVAGYHAAFEVGDEGPIQLTPWRAA